MADEKQFHEVPAGSHATELLASERTFLAWIRTSIAALSFGIAIIKFDDWARSGSQSNARMAVPLGAAMVVFAGALSAVGAVHYRRTNKQILEGKVEASNWLVLSISASVGLLAIAVIIYLIVRGEY